eukprot:PhM_4_TR4107/c0_g4_i5/m.14949
MTVRHYIPLVKTFALVIGLCCTLLLTTVEGEPTRHVKFLVVGAGPAGIQAAYFLDKYNMDYVVLERADHPGSFFDEFPRSRTLTSTNKRHHAAGTSADARLRHDQHSLLHEPVDAADALLFGDVAGDAYHPSASSVPLYLSAFVERHGLEVLYSHTVVSVSRASASAPFHVRYHDGSSGSDGELTADVVLMGTGVAPRHTQLRNGTDLVRYYDTFSTDLESYIDKEVLIISTEGRDAFEIADMLEEYSAHTHFSTTALPVGAFETHYPGDASAVHLNMLDKYQLKSLDAMFAAPARPIAQFRLVKNTKTHKIEFVDYISPSEVNSTGVKRFAGAPVRRGYDVAIVCDGWEFDDSVFDKKTIQPRLTMDKRLPVTTSMFESSNVQGLFFIGALMHARDYAVGSGGHVHGFRYLIRTLVRHLREKHMHVPYPSQSVKVKKDVSMLSQHVLRRLSTTSSIFSASYHLCDLFVLPRANSLVRSKVTVLEDVFFDGVFSGLTTNWTQPADKFIMLSMEYGDGYQGPAAMRGSDVRTDVPHFLLARRSTIYPFDESPDIEHRRLFGSTTFEVASDKKALSESDRASKKAQFDHTIHGPQFIRQLRSTFPDPTRANESVVAETGVGHFHPVLRAWTQRKTGEGVLVSQRHLDTDLGLYDWGNGRPDVKEAVERALTDMMEKLMHGDGKKVASAADEL